MTIPTDTTPPPATLAELDEIERRANAATPGPWYDCGIADVIAENEFRWGDKGDADNDNDAPFIAAARTDVPRLVALARQALRVPPAPPPDADDATRLAMSEMELWEISCRASAATPGPWRTYPNTVRDDAPKGQDVRADCDPGGKVCRDCSHWDMHFIAYARTDVPRMFHEIMRLREYAMRSNSESLDTGNALAATRAALAELVALKDLKDARGKTDDYQRRQPLAWDAARTALADATRAGGKAEGR